jgi:hypothetical protein
VSKPREMRFMIAGGAIAIGLLVGALLVQHLRHGWPFSLHHGMGQVAATSPRAPSTRPSERAPRTTIELDPSRLEAIGVRMERARKELIGEPLRVIATMKRGSRMYIRGSQAGSNSST